MKVLTQILTVFLFLGILNAASLLQKKSLFSEVSSQFEISRDSIGTIYPACLPSEFESLFEPYGPTYVIEKHYINADDGYGLLLFRVQLNATMLAALPKDQQSNILQPVMLQHGLTDSSDGWFVNGKGSIGFHMVDQGYDVWVGNNRGNKYSKTIKNPEITAKEFYDYSFTELGTMDQPAFFNHILAYYAADTQVYYFGHSQGTSQMFVALMDEKTRDFFNKKVKRFFALAPIAYLTDITDFGYKWLSKFRDLIDDAANLFNIYVVEEAGCTKNNEWEQAKDYTCKKSNFLCEIDDSFPDEDIKINSADSTLGHNNLKIHDPSGASVKCFNHYAQIINGGSGNTPIFRPFDYGWFLN